jgi:hypothetical protein
MKGGFWNSDGFRDTAKHCFVHETIRDLKLDFFAIIETGRDNFSMHFLRHLSGVLISFGTAYLHKGDPEAF